MEHMQHRLAKSAGVLILLGILTGFLIAASATGQLSSNVDMMVAAHLNALLGGFWLLGVGWSLPFCTLSSMQQQWMVRLLICCNYANWFWTAVKSFFHVHAISFDSSIPNNVIFVALSIFVVIPALLGAVLWVWGLMRWKPSQS